MEPLMLRREVPPPPSEGWARPQPRQCPQPSRTTAGHPQGLQTLRAALSSLLCPGTILTPPPPGGRLPWHQLNLT